MDRHDRQIVPTRKRAARILANLAAAGTFVLLLAACNGGGLASYQGDSSYGCRTTATRTICPR